MIGILDYGLGNISAFANILKRIDVSFNIVKYPCELENVSHIIMPGVGSFDYCMKRLDQCNFIDALNIHVLQNKKYLLGVCVGMQILAGASEEGEVKGLGWIDGNVRKFRNDKNTLNKLRVPHIGWNSVCPQSSGTLFNNLDVERFYFLHSYHFVPRCPEYIVARSWYGHDFAAAVRKDNIIGVQFHPEKSHDSGLQLLNNFCRL